jgi:hypothetical protein
MLGVAVPQQAKTTADGTGHQYLHFQDSVNVGNFFQFRSDDALIVLIDAQLV